MNESAIDSFNASGASAGSVAKIRTNPATAPAIISNPPARRAVCMAPVYHAPACNS